MPRKKPFSGKQKKTQLQVKRLKKGSSDQPLTSSWPSTSQDEPDGSQAKYFVKGEFHPDRYKLNFLRETREEVDKRKYTAQTLPIKFVEEKELEVDINNVYQPGSVLDMPKRPKWKYTMSKHQLERKEDAYFQEYLENIHKNYGEKNLSYFEHNLETWRQAWRVLEMSDVVVMVTDVRHPVLHFSPALYDHVVHGLKKPLFLVLNKIDLVPASVVAAWTDYFKGLFPELHVVWFTSFPLDVRTVDLTKKLKRRSKPKRRIYTTQIGPKELLQLCKDVCGEKVDLSSWENKIDLDLERLGFQSSDSSPAHFASSGDKLLQQRRKTNEDDEDAGGGDDPQEEEDPVDKPMFHNGILTLGFVGHPNVGKSSLMNGLIGRKVVSTSVTPGHTKYFQTYFLTKTVKLCDSPGLVFPSLIDKQMQILSGIYPIAQVQEPYTPVGYLAARIPVVEILQLSNASGTGEWTAWEICEAWAEKRNYRTAKAARADVYRAANSILRLAVDGRLCMYMRPPGYSKRKAYWQKHENAAGLMALQATGHFHGDGEGRLHLAVEDLYSSDCTTSSCLSDNDSDAGDSFDDDDDDDDDDDITIDEDQFDDTLVSNKFAALDFIE